MKRSLVLVSIVAAAAVAPRASAADSDGANSERGSAAPISSNDDPAPTSSNAESAKTGHSGAVLGLRFGLQLPVGLLLNSAKTGQSVSLGDEFGFAVPIWADFGYQVDENIFLGVYGQVSVATVKGSAPVGSALCSTASCVGSLLRAGVQGIYRFGRKTRIAPWLGIGAGYDWATESASDSSGGSAHVTYAGWELACLQAGIDFKKPKGAGALGPYVAFSLGRYEHADITNGGSSVFSGDIANQTIHGWLQFGLKGALLLL